MGTVGARGSHEFEGLLISAERWPLILMEFPERRFADASLHRGLDCLEAMMVESKHAAEKIFIITDLTRMNELASASQRKHSGEWMGRTLSLQREATLGGANVSPSAIVRGLVTAINWFQKAPMPTVWVATRREAFVVAIKAFEQAGTRLRPDLHAWLAEAAAERRAGGPASSSGRP
jgi:hypothetical protein